MEEVSNLQMGWFWGRTFHIEERVDADKEGKGQVIWEYVSEYYVIFSKVIH